jgi:integral membrane protein
MLSNVIGRLRLAGILEGFSFIGLLGVAMPLKYVWDRPQAVSIVGMAHGILFLLYCLALLLAWQETRWPNKRAALIFGAALVPFGPFLLDPSLRREQGKSGRQEVFSVQ